jgi:hypothetical protein
MQFSKTSSLVDIGHGLVIISEKRKPTQLNIMSKRRPCEANIPVKRNATPVILIKTFKISTKNSLLSYYLLSNLP